MTTTEHLDMVIEETAFTSDGLRCAATIATPPGDHRGGVVVVHGLGATRRMRLDRLVGELVSRGLVVLTFDPRHLGESEGSPRQLVDPERAVQDVHAALGHLRSQPQVHTERVGLVGISFGGGTAMQAAAEDGTLAAFAHVVRYAFPGMQRTEAQQAALVEAALADLAAAERGDEAVMVPIAGWPHEVAAIATADAMYGLGLLDVTDDGRNDLAARSLVALGTYEPGSLAKAIDCPVLYYACEDDLVCPFDATRRAIALTSDPHVVTYRGSHFDVFRWAAQGEHMCRTVAGHLAGSLDGSGLGQDGQLGA